MSRRALTHLLRGYLLRRGAEPAFPAVSLAALATNTAPAHTSTWRDTWPSSQSPFPAQQWRGAASKTPNVARKRLLAARGRQAKVHRPSHQTSAVAAPSQTEPAQEGATQLQVQPSEGPATELQDARTLLQIASVVDHPALIITRSIEWGTVIFGFEQANKYSVYDQDGNVVALMAEEQTGLGNEVGRQLLRTRRSFSMTVLSADGSQIIFRVRRPAYLINSNMRIEDGQGNVVGEVQQRWHLLKRNYDLFMDRQQFAAVRGNFLAWEFELKDAQGGTMALIDRNFQGFTKEIFTDAGKYVIHFGGKIADMAASSAQQGAAGAVEQGSAPAGQLPAAAAAAAGGAAAAASGPPVTPLAVARTDVAVIPTMSGNQLVVSQPLALSERMIALAAAISIDYDYFSHHSHSSGWLPMFMPMPLPGGAAPEPAAGDEAGTAAGGAADAGAAGAAGAASAGFPGADAGAGAAGGFPGQDQGGFGGFGQQQQQQQQGGFGGESEFGQDPGFGQGTDDAESFKWDLGGGEGGEGVGGGDGEGGGIGGLLKGLWDLVSEE